MKYDVKESYNKVCEHWNEVRRKTVINKCIADFTQQLKPHGKILDVGCGTGYPVCAYLADRGFEVTGIDISEKMIEKAKELGLPDAEFYVEDVLTFSPDGKYDGVIAFDSIWHIPHERQEDIYRIISDLTNPGALFLFTHGKEDGEIVGEMWGEPFYYSALNVKKVHSLLRQNGFEILLSQENYKEVTTGERDLLIVAEKRVY